MDKQYAFNALSARMKYISRWGLMRSGRTESLCEHTAETAILAHTLGCLAKEVFGKEVNAERLAVAALYHDAAEILTGDMPTPVKYKSKAFKNAYKTLEAEACDTLAATAPPQIAPTLGTYLTGDALTSYEKTLLKAADRLSAVIKCIEEENGGNREFTRARAQQTAALQEMQCEEASYFLLHMLPCYEYNLDELAQDVF